MNDDTRDEEDEYFAVLFSRPVNADIIEAGIVHLSKEVLGTILDNDTTIDLNGVAWAPGIAPQKTNHVYPVDHTSQTGISTITIASGQEHTTGGGRNGTFQVTATATWIAANDSEDTVVRVQFSDSLAQRAGGECGGDGLYTAQLNKSDMEKIFPKPIISIAEVAAAEATGEFVFTAVLSKTTTHGVKSGLADQ